MMSLVVHDNKESLIAIPISIIENFFDCHKLNESKMMLKEIKEQLIHKSYPYAPGSLDHDNVIYFFEKIDELIDAAYLLNSK